jgi:hypothetical protein
VPGIFEGVVGAVVEQSTAASQDKYDQPSGQHRSPTLGREAA